MGRFGRTDCFTLSLIGGIGLIKNKSWLESDLHFLLGDDAYAKLLDNYAGVRLYVPKLNGKNSNLPVIIGEHSTRLLSEIYGGDYVKVPVAREWRARRYRKEGYSNAKIARQLGITENGVEKLFSRLAAADTAIVQTI